MELAHQHLALDFEADGEEEDGHEGIVDERQQRHGLAVVAEEVETAYLQAHLVVPKVEVVMVDGRDIGHDERQHGEENENVTARCMAAQSLARGIEDGASKEGGFFGRFRLVPACRTFRGILLGVFLFSHVRKVFYTRFIMCL